MPQAKTTLGSRWNYMHIYSVWITFQTLPIRPGPGCCLRLTEGHVLLLLFAGGPSRIRSSAVLLEGLGTTRTPVNGATSQCPPQIRTSGDGSLRNYISNKLRW